MRDFDNSFDVVKSNHENYDEKDIHIRISNTERLYSSMLRKIFGIRLTRRISVAAARIELFYVKNFWNDDLVSRDDALRHIELRIARFLGNV